MPFLFRRIVFGFLLTAFVLLLGQYPGLFVQAQLPDMQDHASEGYASWYGPKFAGRQTANGEIFDPGQLTAAHKTMPFGSYVQVKNLNNNRTVTVRINDRGPFKPGRIIDLSRYAAEVIDMIGPGTVPVELELIDPYAQQAPQVEIVTDSVELPTYRIASDLMLSGFEIVTERYPVGKLLILSGQGRSVMVRVASNQMPLSSGVDFFVSSQAFSLLGDKVSLSDR